MRFKQLHKHGGIVAALLLSAAACDTGGPEALDSAAAVYRPASLLEAVLMGDPEAVRQFLADNVDVNAAEPDGTTPLMRAIHGRFPDIAATLLAAGADPSAVNRYGVTSLYLAARKGDAATTRALLAAGADANTSLPEGETTLMTAAKTGNADVVRALLTGGADTLSLADLAEENAAASAAASSGYAAVTNPASPANRADVDAREGWYGQTALMWAAGQGHAEVVRLLVEAGANVDDHSRQIDIPNPYQERLDGSFVSPDNPQGGLTALHFAAREGHLDAAQALIDAGANLDAVDQEGTNALIYATSHRHLDLAALLLTAGADPNVADRYGRTVLFVATDVNTLDTNATATDAATSSTTPVDVVELALARGADPNAALTGELPNDLPSGIERDPLLSEGTTAFFRAAMAGDLAVMRRLLDAGADPLATTAAQTDVQIGGTHRAAAGLTTTFMAAAGVGWRESISRGRDRDALGALELLLEHGADVNAANQAGDTALHGAALRGSPAIIQFLVDRGANLRAKNAKGQTPLDIAMGVPNERVPYNEATASLLRRLLAQRS
jgi:ankyrin repeat protein